MLIPLSQLNEIYDEIRQTSFSRGCSLAILVAGDCDALAACKILTQMLHKDTVQYRVIPVANYTELEEKLASFTDPELKCLVFLNCGGSCDLTQLGPEKNLISYVFDSERPFWADNIKSAYVKLIDDTFVEEPEDQEEEESEIENEPGQKRRREGREDKPRKRFKNDPDPTGVYFGISTAGIIYRLAQQMNRATNEMLWMWIVGLTDQYLHRKIDRSEYEQRINECLTEVLRLNEHPYQQRGDEAEEMDQDSDQRTVNGIIEPKDFDTEKKTPGNIHIEHKDLKLMLYRHWSLYDSLYYSDYVACKLGIWREPGKRRLNEIIAQLGIPLQECRQDFCFMKPMYKKTLKDKLQQIGATYEIEDLFLTTCIRQYNRKKQFSASDIVYSVTALLESPTLLGDQEESNEREKWLSNFWIAHDALLDVNYLEQGIKIAQDQQKAIVQQGTILIEKKAVNPAADFRYAIISSDSLNQTKYFHHPLSLKKLTTFIMEAYRELRSNIRPKPMVLCVLNTSRNTFLVTGVTSAVQQRNDFGWRFHEAAQAVEADFRRDFFEDTYIEVRKEHFQAFLEQLTAGAY